MCGKDLQNRAQLHLAGIKFQLNNFPHIRFDLYILRDRPDS